MKKIFSLPPIPEIPKGLIIEQIMHLLVAKSKVDPSSFSTFKTLLSRQLDTLPPVTALPTIDYTPSSLFSNEKIGLTLHHGSARTKLIYTKMKDSEGFEISGQPLTYCYGTLTRDGVDVTGNYSLIKAFPKQLLHFFNPLVSAKEKAAAMEAFFEPHNHIMSSRLLRGMDGYLSEMIRLTEEPEFLADSTFIRILHNSFLELKTEKQNQADANDIWTLINNVTLYLKNQMSSKDKSEQNNIFIAQNTLVLLTNSLPCDESCLMADGRLPDLTDPFYPHETVAKFTGLFDTLLTAIVELPKPMNAAVALWHKMDLSRKILGGMDPSYQYTHDCGAHSALRGIAQLIRNGSIKMILASQKPLLEKLLMLSTHIKNFKQISPKALEQYLHIILLLTRDNPEAGKFFEGQNFSTVLVTMADHFRGNETIQKLTEKLLINFQFLDNPAPAGLREGVLVDFS